MMVNVLFGFIFSMRARIVCAFSMLTAMHNSLGLVLLGVPSLLMLTIAYCIASRRPAVRLAARAAKAVVVFIVLSLVEVSVCLTTIVYVMESALQGGNWKESESNRSFFWLVSSGRRRGPGREPLSENREPLSENRFRKSDNQFGFHWYADHMASEAAARTVCNRAGLRMIATTRSY